MSDEAAPSRRSAQRELTRARLLDAAADEFHEYGFSQAQIVRIAARVEMTRGAFYGHFSSLTEVAVILLERDLDRERASLDELTGTVTSGEELLHGLESRRSHNVAFTSSFLADLILNVERDAELRERLLELYRQRVTMLSPLIETSAATLERDLTDSPERLAHILIALELGLALAARVVRAAPDIDAPERLGDVLHPFFLGGASTPR